MAEAASVRRPRKDHLQLIIGLHLPMRADVRREGKVSLAKPLAMKIICSVADEGAAR